jgi:uncharacterized protein (TIGR02145 family)
MNRIFTQAVKITDVIILLLMTSCDYYIKPPYTSSTWISDISTNKAIAKSRIIWDGGSDIKECGFCWNTSGYPTKDDFFIEADEISERFSGKLKDLSDGTKYYVRSYAINKADIFYGEVMSFTTEAFKLPAVSSPYITYVTHNTVICSGGGISSDNSFNIFSKGICWSTSINPTIDDLKVELGSGFGSIGYKIEGLMPGTVYYFRAYATNVVGIAYGRNLVARTFDGYMTDFEGHVYSTVRLGNQEWMNRNLETSYFSNGDRIKTTGTPTLNTEQEDKPVYQWAFLGHEDHPELLDEDGRLYTWYTATDSRKICPAGSHLPTLNEWNELIFHLGGDALTSRDFRWCFNYYWDSMLNTGATEGSFNAQLAGFRDVTGQFQYGSNYGTYWWSATEVSSENGYVIYCGPADFDKVYPTEKNRKYGYSVRCVKN